MTNLQHFTLYRSADRVALMCELCSERVTSWTKVNLQDVSAEAMDHLRRHHRAAEGTSAAGVRS